MRSADTLPAASALQGTPVIKWPAEATESAAREPGCSHSEQLRLLYAGDDEDTRVRLVNTLGNLELVFARDAYDALCRINSCPFDLYIIENWLASWAGVSLCRDIRKDDPHVPVCLLTSTMSESMDRARRAGANVCLSKPLDERLLDEHVGTLLETAGRRNVSARDAGLTAARQEIQSRRLAVGEAVFSEQFAAGLKRVARRKAQEAFRQAGGTMISFQRSWEFVWRAAYMSRSLDGLELPECSIAPSTSVPLGQDQSGICA